MDEQMLEFRWLPSPLAIWAFTLLNVVKLLKILRRWILTSTPHSWKVVACGSQIPAGSSGGSYPGRSRDPRLQQGTR